MKTLSLVLLGLGMSFMCQAQIAVFKLKISTTTDGGSKPVKAAESGFFIIDYSSTTVGFVEVFTNQTFTVYNPNSSNYDYGIVSTGGGESWDFTLSKSHGSISMMGKPSPVNLSTNVSTHLPKAVTFSGLVTSRTQGSTFQVTQIKGAAAFDVSDTFTGTEAGEALADTETRLGNVLINDGFTNNPDAVSALNGL